LFKDDSVVSDTSKSQPELVEGLSPSKGDFCGSGPENPLEIALRRLDGSTELAEVRLRVISR
jgi:hypothetical protein